MFMNRYCEIAWMTHRLIPLIQPPGVPFDGQWKDKWRLIEESFSRISNALTKDLGKPIGAAIAVYVTTKFPFNADSEFPWNSGEKARAKMAGKRPIERKRDAAIPLQVGGDDKSAAK
jgi:hypothetical protein